jgi:hypothetical protein
MVELVKKLAVLGVATCVILLSGELLMRYLIPAWPFEPGLYRPPYLTARPAAAMAIFLRGWTE